MLIHCKHSIPNFKNHSKCVEILSNNTEFGLNSLEMKDYASR